MKFGIVQYYIGNDPIYLELCHIVQKLNSKYAEIYNYSYIFKYINSDKNLSNNEKYQNGYKYKIQFMLQNLNNFQYLIFIDADAAVSNPNIPLDYMIDKTHQIFLTRGNGRLDLAKDLCDLSNHLNNIVQNYTRQGIKNFLTFEQYYFQQTNYDIKTSLQKLVMNPLYFNQGFFIIKNTQSMKKLLKLSLENMNIFESKTNKLTNDGRVLGFFLQQKQFKDKYIFLTDYAQGHLMGYKQAKYNVDTHFLMHNYGSCCALQDKLKAFKILQQNKFWKPIFDK